MSSMPVTERITADEYLALDLPPRHELVDGRVVVNAPSLRHGLLTTRLLVALSDWTREGERRGFVIVPIDVGVDRHNVYAPDLLWYSAARSPAPDAPPPYPLPDLAIEIRSPSTWRHDIGVKKRVYESEGLPELWLVDSDANAVLAFRRSKPASPTFNVALELDATATLTSPLLPGFALDVGALFDLST
jgi:Uma2 family endonuclease